MEEDEEFKEEVKEMIDGVLLLIEEEIEWIFLINDQSGNSISSINFLNPKKGGSYD